MWGGETFEKREHMEERKNTEGEKLEGWNYNVLRKK